ncbi:MAG TPA: helix-turn-helix transcriptional regulator [Terracidiphilus sp.]|nr:helix-turn-helix transcriptional regulator [Terracidiphilus sp.]
MADLHTRFRVRLKLLRVGKNLRQEDLARLCNCSVNTIQKIEGGKVLVNLDHIERFAAAMKIPERDFFDFGDVSPNLIAEGVKVRARIRKRHTR